MCVSKTLILEKELFSHDRVIQKPRSLQRRCGHPRGAEAQRPGGAAQTPRCAAHAGSLSAFAGALVAKRGQSPEPLLSRVAQYHASLGLGPAQYLVLRDQLMWSIVDVLGDTVTLTMTAAWDELYWLMTDMLNNIAPDPAPPPS